MKMIKEKTKEKKEKEKGHSRWIQGGSTNEPKLNITAM
jgi:hypothetical protein